jgi:hypothetical protein
MPAVGCGHFAIPLRRSPDFLHSLPRAPFFLWILTLKQLVEGVILYSAVVLLRWSRPFRHIGQSLLYTMNDFLAGFIEGAKETPRAYARRSLPFGDCWLRRPIRC